MKPEEIVAVVGTLAVAFGRDATPELFEVYEIALADLEVPDPVAWVKRSLRTLERWPAPGVLRRMVLADFGLLAPDEDQAWVLAKDLAIQQTPFVLTGFDPVVLEAVRAVGGTWAIRTSQETTIRAQFRDAYRLAKARADQETLERTWSGLALIPGGDDDRRRALGPG